MIIAVDFDGTCVTHDYPRIGKDIGAIPVLKKLVDTGHKLILYTMRSDELLLEAKVWLKMHGIDVWAVNNNPTQSSWTNSKKVYANLYIDDAALGCPLISNKGMRSYVDWNVVELKLIQMGIIK